ncbi:hypothetical protein QQP08_019422 [Theobroma cacao]|nr:hypothetical protein QQP08_019422 [Theobroma cacao]
MADIFSVTTLQETLCPPKAESPVVTPLLTPFSAVVPARFSLARLNIHITLATIHEEENEEESMEHEEKVSFVHALEESFKTCLLFCEAMFMKLLRGTNLLIHDFSG